LKQLLFSRDLKIKVPIKELSRPPTLKLDKVLRQDTSLYSLPTLLRYADRNAMAHSVESRMPFLDFRLLDFLLALPASLKIHDGWTKWILRKTISQWLPKEIAWRRDKLGFPVPERVWLQEELREEIHRKIRESELLKDTGIELKRADKPSLLWRFFWLAITEKVFFGGA
jgi:asparagine synthase (glutamine-hydrolysing)